MPPFVDNQPLPVNPPYDYTAVLSRVSAGEEQAFAELFRQESPAVYNAALLVTANAVLAEEVVQDVFLKIWLKRDTLPAIQDFRSYVFIIARNQAYKALKKQLNWELRPNADDWADEAVHLADLDEAHRAEQVLSVLEEAVALLPEQQQQVFRLSKQQRMKREEVAAAMQLSPETVKKYLAAAVLKIRSYCQTHHPELFLEMIGLLVILAG